MIQHDQSPWAEREYLATEFGADRTASTGHKDYHSFHTFIQKTSRRGDGIPAKKLLDGHFFQAGKFRSA